MDCNSNSVCRTCLACNVELISIFDDNIAKMLGFCNFIEVTVNDGLPSKICATCKNLTLQSYNFKQQCELSDSKLRCQTINYMKHVDVNEISNEKELPWQSAITPNSNEEGNEDDHYEKLFAVNYSDNSEDKSDVFVCPHCLHKYDDLNSLTKHLEESNSKCARARATNKKCDEEHQTKTIYSDSDSEDKVDVNNDYGCVSLKNEVKSISPLQFMCKEYINKIDVDSVQSNPSNEDTFDTSRDTDSEFEENNVETNCIYSSLKTEAVLQLQFPCKECKKSFNSEHDLKLHESIHVDSSEYVCPNCKKKFSKLQILKRHIITHMLQKPHVCVICNKGFAQSQDLTKHLRMHNGLLREKKHFCKNCGKGFAEPYYLNIHMRKHTGERPLKCDICGKGFANPGCLKAHNMIHTGEKPFKCHICEKAFTQNIGLTQHIRTHTGEKPYVCSECGKCFKQSSALEKHSRSHLGYKPHICKYCSKRFIEKNALANHIRTHTGEKPYVCEQCGKAFVSSSQLSSHNRKHLGIKKNICNFCCKDFPTPSKLRAHIRIHTGERPFSCTYCNKDFIEKGALKKHIKIHESFDKELNVNKIELSVSNVNDSRSLEIKNETTEDSNVNLVQH